jgi:hypothetical protein
MRGKPSTHSSRPGGGNKDFGEAFGITTARQAVPEQVAPGPSVQSRLEEAALLSNPYPFSSPEPNGNV